MMRTVVAAQSVQFLGWVTPDDSEMRENVHNPTALLFWARILPDPQKWEMWLFCLVLLQMLMIVTQFAFVFPLLPMYIQFCRSKIRVV